MKTLLVVDDDPFVLTLATLVLQQSSYRCLKAASGSEALQVLSANAHIDALISDILMPGMTGIELGRSIRQDRRELPILFISGFAGSDKDEAAGLFHQPKVAFLPKPFTPTQLRSAVAALLGE